MKNILLLTVLVLVFSSCSAQTTTPNRDLVVGGPCEGCEALHEYGDQELNAIDTLPDFAETEPKLLLQGTVFESDGVTPAPGIILYIYHTNRDGIYPSESKDPGWLRRHGYIRGWVKTDEQGAYAFYTFRPGAYPSRNIPEHIHITLKEPGKTAYYIDEFEFLDDPLLTDKTQANRPNRSGSGLVQPVQKGDLLIVDRDIILGLNIPQYP